MSLKKPLAVNDEADIPQLVEVDGRSIAEVHGSSGGVNHGGQIVRELNAFDGLLAACEAVLPWLRSLEAQDKAGKKLQQQLEAAIEAAKPGVMV